MKIFDLSYDDVLKIKKREIIFLVLTIVLGLGIVLAFLFIAKRETFILFLILSLVVTLIATTLSLYIILGRFKTVKQYLLILKKSENSKESDIFFFKNEDEQIYLKDGLSYHKYTFYKEGQDYAFYVLFDKKLDVKENESYKLIFVENILLELENHHEKD